MAATLFPSDEDEVAADTAKRIFARASELSRQEVADLGRRFFLFTVVRDPYSLMERLGLEFEPAQLQWADMPHHNIGSADVFRKTVGSTIRPDDAWKTVIPPYMQRIINIIAWPGRVVNDAKERRWGLD